MTEKPATSSPRNSPDLSKPATPEKAVPEAAILRFRAALNAHKGKGLSPQARDALHELCSQARRSGVLPERVIVRVKDEIRLIPDFSDERDEERARMEAAVTACIQSFFGTAS